jgi:phenol 2-monooxygenase
MSSSKEFVPPVVTEYFNNSLPNELGVTSIPAHPDILNGTNCDNPIVPDYKPPSEVDVLIVGGTWKGHLSHYFISNLQVVLSAS